MKYLVLILTIVIGLFFTGCASTSNGNSPSGTYYPKQSLSNWIKDQKGCKIWNAHPLLNETITWTGKCVNGYIEGYGTLQWYLNGRKTSKNIGEYKHGKREGKSTYYYYYEKDGRKYIGNHINDLAHGKGTYFYKNGTKETGNWRNGKRHGIFNFFREDGINYKIKYKRNRPQPYWIKDQTGCKHWNPKPKLGETVSWTGDCINGYGDGYGTLRWYNGSGHYSENNVLQRKGKIDKNEKMSFPYFIKKGYHKNFKEKELKILIDKEKPYVEVIITYPNTKIKLFAIEHTNDVSCTKNTETYTRRLGAMEQLFTLGTSSKATVTEYQHTCKFQNGYKNRMKNLITELNPSNLSSALKTLEGMEYWRSVSTSENWHVMDFVRKAAYNASNRNTSYSSPSSSNSKTQVKKTHNIKNNKPCSYKVENKRGNSTIIKCSDGHRADIKFRKNKWRRVTGILSGYYNSFEEAANKECECSE